MAKQICRSNFRQEVKEISLKSLISTEFKRLEYLRQMNYHGEQNLDLTAEVKALRDVIVMGIPLCIRCQSVHLERSCLT